MEDNKLKEIEIAHSTLENVDQATFDWLDKSLNISTVTNKGFVKVPVKFVAGEKSYQAKRDNSLRDSSGALILPLITVERTGVVKDPSKSLLPANIPNLPGIQKGAITVSRRIKQDKTSNFENALSKRKFNKINYKSNKSSKTVYETVTIPVPVYVEVSYKVSLRSEYQQQMNEMIQPFITTPGTRNCVIIENNNHKFEAFIQSDYAMQNTVSDMSEKREYETTIEIKVVASLIGDSSNQETPKYAVRQNAVELKITREVSILDPDEIERLS